MNTRTIQDADSTGPSPTSPSMMLDGMLATLVIFIPNMWMALHVAPAEITDEKTDNGSRFIATYSALEWDFYLRWLLLNLLLVGALFCLRNYLLRPLRHIAQHLQLIRSAYHQEQTSGARPAPLNMLAMASDVSRFAGFAMEYYRKHHEISEELAQARQIITQFALHQDTLLGSTGREIGTQYRSVLAYANYLEEQIMNNKLDPLLRYDFDEVCESSFNLKLIAGALAMLSVHSPPHITTVPLAALMQRTMLSLAPALDRRSMKLTTAEVDMAVAAHGDPGYIAHILWMMLLGMVRYAADESTLRIRCLHNRESTHALMSIVVSELSPLQLSEEERSDYLMRQLQHLTPHMFAETIRIHGNVQLADLLLKRMEGRIEVLPLTTASCEICMVLPSAHPPLHQQE